MVGVGDYSAPRALDPNDPSRLRASTGGAVGIANVTLVSVLERVGEIGLRRALGAGLAGRPQAWREGIEWATLDLSGPYRKVFDTMLADAGQIADPFHLIKLAKRGHGRNSASGAERHVRP